MNQDFVLDLFYSLKGDLNKINAVIDEKMKQNQTRKITTFEMYIKSRIALDPTVLGMAKMEMTPLEAAYLSRYPALDKLEILDLRQNHLGDEGLDAIASSPVFQNLRELDLRGNGISRLGMKILARSTSLPKLEKVDLRANKLGKRWETKLKEGKLLPNLKEVRTL